MVSVIILKWNMRVNFLVENVEKLLPVLTRALPNHPQIPILANLLIEAKNNGFFISTTSLEAGIKVKIPAKIEEEGGTTVPGKQFIEALSLIPPDKISLSLEKNSLKISSRGNTVVFQTMPKEDFPSLFDKKGERVEEFPAGELKKNLSKLVFASAADGGRAELGGVLLAQKDGFMDMVATDGFRLSLRRLEKKRFLSTGESLIVPSKTLSEARDLGEEGGISMYVYKEGNQVLFEKENLVLVGRIIDGEFPSYEKVIPPSFKTKIKIATEEFVQKIRLAAVFARDSANIVKLKASSGKITISSRAPGVGEQEAVLDAEKEGEDTEIAFNIRFLTDLLKNTTEETIIMELSGALDPAVFKMEGDEGFLHIIMPVRLQE